MPVYSDANPNFLPAMRIIAGISSTNPMIVTTVLNHDYLDHLRVRLIVPEAYAMWQANQLTEVITVISPTQFSMPVDATNFTSFVMPSGAQQIPAQAVADGQELTYINQAEQNVWLS